MSIQTHPDFIMIDAEIADMVGQVIEESHSGGIFGENTASLEYYNGYRDGLIAALRVLRKPVGEL